jgi:hypothetical protein
MAERVSDLSANIGPYLKTYQTAEPFGGPSWYFHRRALDRRFQHGRASTLFEDDLFFDYLYATLTAWGLHRMGPGNTKLRDLQVLRGSLREQAASIQRLWDTRMTRVEESDRHNVAIQVWDVLAALRVSIADARIVAGSKALHHVLPNLVPPIDRHYTFNFFYGRTSLSISEDVAFIEMYGGLLQMAGANADRIEASVGEGWNTSISKVLDNAVVGYILSHEAQGAGLTTG